MIEIRHKNPTKTNKKYFVFKNFNNWVIDTPLAPYWKLFLIIKNRLLYFSFDCRCGNQLLNLQGLDRFNMRGILTESWDLFF
jgi:hypothetical protein